MGISLRDRIRNTSIYKKVGVRLNVLKGRLYDMRHGVHTAPEIHLEDLDIESPNASRGGNYSGTEPNYFRQIMDGLDLDLSQFTFIDLGSGMGRALFLASEKPFKRIIGVEFARELHEIAEANITKFRSPDQKCFDISSVCEDAAAFELPDTPLICYLFNPFDREVFERVIANFERSLKTSPREFYVIYTNPMHNDLFVASPAFEQIAEGPWHTLHLAVRS
ncbi:MAG: class I SAM-dependent methyltransferase [Acidobacteriota bacterium]|nr:MAG: class I SAM-dependent methyltransferase [Acidobacteriota bacterium]